MKVKELIKELKDYDQDAEVICWSDGPLYCIDQKPGYYDGCTSFLVTDEECEDYNIVGYGYDNKRNKVCLIGMDLSDCLYDLNPEEIDDFQVKMPKDPYYDTYRKLVKEIKEEVKNNLIKWQNR